MIGKVIGGKSFTGTVGYVMKKDAVLLESDGITPPNVKDMVQDFQDQTLLNPRVKNVVGHISISFSERDKAKLTDDFMRSIAKEYMQKMGIDNTQYLIVRHHDAPHPHCHVVYNRVKNDGTTVPDSNIRLRNVAACRELTEKHGFYFASGKENVREHRLREPDKTRYEIYNALQTTVPSCRSWDELWQALGRQGVGIEFIRNGSTDKIQGVKFTKNDRSFSGSKIDQAFSYSKLDNYFNRVQRAEQRQEAPKFSYSPQSRSNLQTAVGGYMSAFGKRFSSHGGDIDLSTFGMGSLPLPSMDLGIGISAAQLQRQPDETPEHHIARVTALINQMTAAILAQIEEQKRKQQQQAKKPKIRL